MSKVKVVFIGCGGMAGAHLRGFIELKRKGVDIFDIVALADPDEQRTAKFATDISEVQPSPKVARYTDFEKMLSERKPDAADVCTPHFLHHNCAIACFEAGVDVIVEKPLGVTMKAGRKMIDSAKEHGRILAIAEQVRRWIGPRATGWALENGLIGAPRMFFAQIMRAADVDPADMVVRGRPLTWRQNKLTGGGGPVFDGGVHYADLLIHYFGDLDSVYAHTGRFGGLKHLDQSGAATPTSVEDTSITSLKFKSGVVGTWNWSSVAFGRALNYTAYYGAQGSIYADGIYPNAPHLQLWDGTEKAPGELIGEFLAAVGKDTIDRYFPPELGLDPATAGGQHGVTLEVYDFLQAVRDRREPEMDGWDGLVAQAVPMAFYESAACGEAVKVDDVLSGRVDAYQREVNEKWGI